MANRFRNQTVIVTGASSGVGAASARLFAAEGARVVLAARGAALLEGAAKEIGERAIAIPCDVSDPEQARALIQGALEATGRLDVLVNNAAVNHRGKLGEIEPTALAQIVDVNLKAPIVLSRLALPHLREAEKGAIVNVASIAGQFPLDGEATYSATKFGLRGFTMALAAELRGTSVSASVVSPGPIDTPFISQELDSVPDVVFSQPMCTAEEVAKAVVECAVDGRLERTLPRVTGALATVSYLLPDLPRLLRPMLDAQGRRAKERYREKHGRP